MTVRSSRRTPRKRPSKRVVAGCFALAIGAGALRGYLRSDATDDWPIEAFAIPLLLVGAAMIVFGVRASDERILRLEGDRSTSPRTLRRLLVGVGALMAAMGIGGVLFG